jgi:hypothetical protein
MGWMSQTKVGLGMALEKMLPGGVIPLGLHSLELAIVGS